MKTALVTGADGFVGEHLVADLLAQEYKVTGSVLALPPKRNTLTTEQSGQVEWKPADLLDPAALHRLMIAVQPEQIFHLAGFSSAGRARSEPSQALLVNAIGTLNLLEAVLAARAELPELDPRLLVMGSAIAYGDAAGLDDSLHEEIGLLPSSSYGLSKACQELVAETYRRSHELRVVVTRLFNHVGPGQGPEFAIPSFCAQAAEIAAGRAEPALQVGDLDVERDFLDVRDGVAALRLLGEHSSPQSTYNIGSGRAVSLRTVLDWILQEAGVDPEIRVDRGRQRKREIQRLRADTRRLEADTGWRPQRELESTVRETYRWVAKRRA